MGGYHSYNHGRKHIADEEEDNASVGVGSDIFDQDFYEDDDLENSSIYNNHQKKI